MKNKITKETIPEGFSLKLAFVDLIPVLFFGAAMIVFGLLFKSPLFLAGAFLSFLSGLVKVIWKMIVATKNKNVWPLFVQMRIVMPLGFLLMLIAFVLYAVKGDFSSLSNFTNPICITFLVLCALGMVMMSVFAFVLDSSDQKSNWIEQICNSFAQGFLFIACLLAFLL